MTAALKHGACASAVVLLLGCTAPRAPTPAPPVPPPRPAPRAAPDAALLEFERVQLDRAERALAAGDLAAAALALHALRLVRPDDEGLRARLDAVQRRIAASTAERLAAAQAAHRRGDADGAAHRYLELLALDPAHREAAQALRAIEAERRRRSLGATPSRNDAYGRGGRLAPTGRAADPVREEAGVLEHATLLARQGDVDDAIQALRDAPQTRASTALRALLADLYVRKAEALRQRDPEAALAAVNAALAIDRRHARALAVHQQMQPRAGQPAGR